MRQCIDVKFSLFFQSTKFPTCPWCAWPDLLSTTEVVATDPATEAAAIGPDMEAAVATGPAVAVSTPVVAAADSAAAPARPALPARASEVDSEVSEAVPATPTPLVRPSTGRFIFNFALFPLANVSTVLLTGVFYDFRFGR
jgi:hypothetical protein